MLEDLIGSGEYYHFPSFEVALYSLLLSFVLSAVIGLVYWLTFSGKSFPIHFFQAIVLSSMVSSMVIMAVGNNVAAGFGIIGALAIIRFRTTIQNPRNIIFIFAALSIGIATGVYGYAIAISGTLLFSMVAVVLFYSPFGSVGKHYFELQLTVQKDTSLDFIKEKLRSFQLEYSIIEFRKQSAGEDVRYVFKLELSKKIKEDLLFEYLIKNDEFLNVRLQESTEEVL